MPSAKEFREFALRCMDWAEEARDERQRQVMRDLAAQWMRSAVRVERSIARLDDDVPLVPENETIRGAVS